MIFRNIKKFVSKSGPTFCQPGSGAKLFTKVINRRQQSPIHVARKCIILHGIHIKKSSPFIMTEAQWCSGLTTCLANQGSQVRSPASPVCRMRLKAVAPSLFDLKVRC